MSNPYISYLNSLHNVSANGSNALAESQALSDFFSEVYEPFPIVQHVAELLTENKSRVVILTGHAGDGKSTVAIDVLKQLRGIPQSQTLSEPLKEREEVVTARVNIVKDMSELSKGLRIQWLTEAFEESGSWLVVSNTGPLLDSLFDYCGDNHLDIESSVLDALNRPLEAETTSAHKISGFDKELVIINLTRLDNVHLGAKLITKLVKHTGWTSCSSCDAKLSCPIKKNRDVLLESLTIVEERIRWVYARLTAYEHRLTLRQILAHLAFSLTAGEGCDGVIELFTSGSTELETLPKVIFSETFFGLCAGRRDFGAENLHAISILQKEKYGAPVGVDFDRQLLTQNGMDWSVLPEGLSEVKTLWSERAKDAKGTRWRFALRRMNYIFGKADPVLENRSELYIDSFLNSYGVRLFDKWKGLKQLDLKKSDRKKLNDLCLNVLLELSTGFNAYQYSTTGSLYLTLRRKDQNVVQPTQLVVEKFSFREFDIKYNPVICLPELVFRHNTVVLPLSLPLFDYIQARNRGELGSSLSPIYQSQIDWFQSELLRVTENEREEDDDEITVIKAGINGDVSIHHFLLDSEHGALEIES